MLIRRESPDDFAAVRALVEAAFPSPLEGRLVEQLRADGDAVVAGVVLDDRAIIGHVMLSRMSAPFRALGLAPIAVAPARQNRGIGSALVRWGLDRAEQDGWQGVFVLGEPAYYRRFGFDPSLAAGFTSPYAGPYLMARALGGPLPALTGKIDYAAAFAAFE